MASAAPCNAPCVGARGAIRAHAPRGTLLMRGGAGLLIGQGVMLDVGAQRRSESHVGFVDGALHIAEPACHGVGAGTAHGASTSIDLKSAGLTISRYSMSGE